MKYGKRERCLNQYGTAVFDRVCRAFVELNLGSTHGAPSESDVAPVSLQSRTYSIRFSKWIVRSLNQDLIFLQEFIFVENVCNPVGKGHFPVHGPLACRIAPSCVSSIGRTESTFLSEGLSLTCGVILYRQYRHESSQMGILFLQWNLANSIWNKVGSTDVIACDSNPCTPPHFFCFSVCNAAIISCHPSPPTPPSPLTQPLWSRRLPGSTPRHFYFSLRPNNHHYHLNCHCISNVKYMK